MKMLKIFAVILVMLCFHMSWASENAETKSDTRPYELKNVDTKPQVIKAMAPSYPISAKIKNIEGRVVLKFVVTTEGTARDIEVCAADPEGIFEEAAIESLKFYLFSPGMKDGKPVETIAKIPIAFELEVGEEYRTLSDAYNENFKLCIQQIEDGQYLIAIGNLTSAIKLYNKHSPAYYLRGLGYRATGEYEKALSDFNRAIKLDSREPVYYDERGVVYSLLAEYPKAIKDFEKAIELNPNLNEAYFHRGDAFKKSGNYSDAIEDYTKGISMDDGNLQAYICRGYCYSKLNHISNVCADFNKACELGDCQGYDALKESGICLGDVSEVLETIQK